MTCNEAQELLTAFVDQELADSERVLLAAHLQDCAGCRRALEREEGLKKEIRSAGDRICAPDHLRNKILSDRRIFSQKPRLLEGQQEFGWPRVVPFRLAAIMALLLLVVALPSLYLWNQSSAGIALTALETYELFRKGELTIIRGETAEEIETHLTRAVVGRFRPMGYDLRAMNLRPVAGVVREIHGRKILVAIYQGQGGLLLCYTFLGSEKDAPPNAARFFDPDKKMNFYAFSHGKVNAVLHREGDVVCILASEIAVDELLTLARSKARPS